MRKKEKIKTNEKKKKTLFKYTMLQKIAFVHVPVESGKIFPPGSRRREERRKSSVQVAINTVFHK